MFCFYIFLQGNCPYPHPRPDFDGLVAFSFCFLVERRKKSAELASTDIDLRAGRRSENPEAVIVDHLMEQVLLLILLQSKGPVTSAPSPPWPPPLFCRPRICLAAISRQPDHFHKN